MAFKVLTEKDLSYLKEDDRIAYEKTYEEYLERVKLVKRLNDLDNVKLPDYQLEKKSLRRINVPHVKTHKPAKVKTRMPDSMSDFLNAASKVENTHKTVETIRPVSGYSALLPSLYLKSPDKVSVKYNESCIAKLPDVPVSNVPKAVEIENGQFKIELVPINSIAEPYSKDVSIKPTDVIRVKDLKIATPDDVCFKDIKKSLTKLPKTIADLPNAVTFAAPTVKKVELYTQKTIAPTVKTDVPRKVELSDISVSSLSVPRVKMDLPIENTIICDNFKFDIKAPKINCTMSDHTSIDIPELKISKFPDISFSKEGIVRVSSSEVYIMKAPSVSGNVIPVKPPLIAYDKVIAAPETVMCAVTVSKVHLPETKSVAAPEVEAAVMKTSITPYSPKSVIKPDVHIDFEPVLVRKTFQTEVAIPDTVRFERTDKITISKTFLQDIQIPELEQIRLFKEKKLSFSTGDNS